MKKSNNALTLMVSMILLVVMIAGCGASAAPVATTAAPATTASEAAAAETTAAPADTTAAPMEMTKLTLQLKWLPQSQFMGYYVAKEKGYYAEQGIDIEILPGGSDIIPEQQVFNGVADVGVTWVSTLLKYQEQGWDLIHAGQIFQKSAMLLVSKKATGIAAPADLMGKKIGSWFGGNEYEIYALLEANGIDREKDLTLVQQDFTMNQLINDEVDAASAMIYNEYGLLLESGIAASDLSVIDMNDAGVAMLEDCLFVNKDWIEKNEDLYVRFLKASIKGWADAAADPEGAGKIVFAADESVSMEHQVYMAKEVAKLVVPEGFDPALIGQTDMAAMKQTADSALKYGLLTKDADLSEAKIATKYWKLATGK